MKTELTLEFKAGALQQRLIFSETCASPEITAEVEHSDGYLRLQLHPHVPLELLSVELSADFSFRPDDRVYLNGYQSWTDSAELTAADRMHGLRGLPRNLVKKYGLDGYGDYLFTEYSLRKGCFHGFGYGYLRRGEQFTLLGSLAEATGYTVVYTDLKANRVRIEKDCAGRRIESDYTALELRLFQGGYDEVFSNYFDALALPAPQGGPLLGYTSWYNHHQNISEEKLLHDLQALNENSAEYQVFQIDDGYQQFVGDWLKLNREKFPRGLSPVVEAAQAKHMKAGLWLAPFACERKSELCGSHPDWLVRGADGKPFLCGCNWSGFYALDIYNRDVRAYLKEVFDFYRKLGFTFFKLDFLYAACVVPRPDKTRGEIMADAMRLLRDLAGDCPILACGAPLLPSAGLAEYMRIGCDVTQNWNGSPLLRLLHREVPGTRASVLNTIYRSHLNKRVFLNDPDVFFLRRNVKLTADQKWVLLATGMLFGSLHFTSDDLQRVDSAGSELLKKALPLQHAVSVRFSRQGNRMAIFYLLENEKRRLVFRISDGKVL